MLRATPRGIRVFDEIKEVNLPIYLVGYIHLQVKGNALQFFQRKTYRAVKRVNS